MRIELATPKIARYNLGDLSNRAERRKLKQTEIHSLTGLRGIAAIYVVVFHYLVGLAFSNPFNNFIAHGYMAVDLFFALSGFVLALNYSSLLKSGSIKSYWTFLGRRLARIYPLYLVATVCAVVLIAVGRLDTPHGLHSLWRAFVLNLAMVQTWGLAPTLDSPGWSISAEWAAYLLFPLLLSIAYFSKATWGWCTAVLCICAIVLLARLPVVPGEFRKPEALLDLHDHHGALSLWRCLPEFTLGILAARVAGTRAGGWIVARPWLASCIGLVCVVLMCVPRTDVGVVLLFPLLILCLSSDRGLASSFLSWKPVHYLGVISYSIYLVHYLLGAVLGWAHAQAHAGGARHAQAFAAVFGLLLTLPISACAYRWIEAPGRRYFGVLLGTQNRSSRLAAQETQPTPF